ncbi:MAG: type 11 methyltransferase [Frankiales bacterium]|nr:type 11 methyltransferase [Frankiales bacterium]
MAGDEPTEGRPIAGTRAFFGPRAAGWEDRFPDDGPAYAAAVRALDPPSGGVVLDAACGTGRALEPLRAAVGPAGVLLGLDVTPEMLGDALSRGRGTLATLVLADVTRLPLATGSVDAIFAAGLVSHLADPVQGLGELARATRAAGRLAIFHPIGRAALAARHGRQLEPSDVRAPDRIAATLAAAGWRLDYLDDGPQRYLALAGRVAGPRSSSSS